MEAKEGGINTETGQQWLSWVMEGEVEEDK